jgi:predicted ATPase
LHLRIAETLEVQSRELIETQPELFAWHYTEAGLADQAAAFWTRAGQRSAARSALAEAAALFQKALDQLTLLPDSPERHRRELEIRGALGALWRFLKGQAAPETAQAYAFMRELWERLGCPPEFRHVPYGQSMVHVYRGELDQARRVGEELLRLSRDRDDSAGLVLGCSAFGQSRLLAGRFTESRPHLERLLAIYDPAIHGELVHQAGSHPLMTRAFLGLALFCLGWPDQALARSAETIVDARRFAHPTSLAVSLAIGAVQASLAGDFAAMDRRANELTAVATEQGLPFYHAWGAIFRGRAKLRDGDEAGGMALLRDGLAAYRDTGAVMWLPHFIDLLAAGCKAAGQVEEAEGLLDDALDLVARTGERWFSAELNRQKGELLLRQGNSAGAEERYRQALTIAADQRAKSWELRAAASLAQLCREQGRDAEAHEILVPIYGWFTENCNTVDLNEALRRALGDAPISGPSATTGPAATSSPCRTR